MQNQFTIIQLAKTILIKCTSLNSDLDKKIKATFTLLNAALNSHNIV